MNVIFVKTTHSHTKQLRIQRERRRAAQPLPVQGSKTTLFGPKYALERTILSLRFQNFPGEHAPGPL